MPDAAISVIGSRPYILYPRVSYAKFREFELVVRSDIYEKTSIYRHLKTTGNKCCRYNGLYVSLPLPPIAGKRDNGGGAYSGI
jgi:hypothetical protein